MMGWWVGVYGSVWKCMEVYGRRTVTKATFHETTLAKVNLSAMVGDIRERHQG